MVNEDFNLGEALLRDEKHGLIAVESEEAKSAPDENVKAGEAWPDPVMFHGLTWTQRVIWQSRLTVPPVITGGPEGRVLKIR